jgi:hypothetical protein
MRPCPYHTLPCRSTAWRELNERVGGALEKASTAGTPIPHQTLLIELGIDWGQIFSLSQRSTGLIFARYGMLLCWYFPCYTTWLCCTHWLACNAAVMLVYQLQVWRSAC